jgi:Domain of unknown function (DUF1818)
MQTEGFPFLASVNSKNMQKVLKSGAGWRIGWNPNNAYPGLVGADDWAIELTAAELDDFGRLLSQLVDNMRSIQAELMDEESITCDAESELIWMQVAGLPSKYSLRLILNTGRSCEGNWTADAVAELVTAMPKLKVF